MPKRTSPFHFLKIPHIFTDLYDIKSTGRSTFRGLENLRTDFNFPNVYYKYKGIKATNTNIDYIRYVAITVTSGPIS